MTLRRQYAGFTLIEVLVSLVIIGVGMLGIAKIQAIAYASTGTASMRSLAALEASSLAAAMRANRSYWSVAAATANQTISITASSTGSSVTAATDATLLNTFNCAMGGGNAPCTPAQLAAYDVNQWVANLNPLLPSVTGTIFCAAPVTAGYPIDCTVQLSWLERTAGINTQSDGNVMTAPTYTLYVEP
jgi:type IV pilus assembly protein PilV